MQATLLIFLLVAVSGLASLAPAEEAGKTRVVATTGMVADLVREVGGDRVEVEQLMGPGIDPHLYKPTTADASKLSRAEVIFSNGLRLEGRMGKLLERLDSPGRIVRALGDAIPPERLLYSNGEHPDPHIWFDVALWSATIPTVVEALSAADPDGAPAYRANGEALAARWAALDAWCREEAAGIPEGRRVLATSHDAFGYFGRAYGFEVVGLQGISTVSEAAVADVANLAAFVGARGVPAIFVETSVNPEAMRRVAEDAGVAVGAELFSDALGAPGEIRKGFDVGTYEGMIRYNMTSIVEALRGE